MCKLSYEKCVCFVLLVIVAFLSCSGFRIDRLAMADVSKKNSHTSRSSLETRSNNLFLDRLVAISTTDYINMDGNVHQQQQQQQEQHRHRRSTHRIRHARKRHLGQAAQIESDRNASKPKIWKDTKNELNRNLHLPSLPYMTMLMPSPMSTSGDLATQIPPSDLVFPRPTHAVVNRMQRSPKKKHRQKRKKKRGNNHCQKQDLARNAYIADTVMLARAETLSLNRTVNANYSVTFRIIEVFKSVEPRNSETIRLTFIYSKRAQNCEPKHESRLVKANIKKMKEYFLFLKSDGSYSYSVYRTPMLRKKEARRKGGKRDGDRRRNGNNSNDGQIAIVRKVCNATFETILQYPQIDYAEDEKTITCTVKGFPIPLITWFINNTKIFSESRRPIVYNRRNSTLTIDEGSFYKCTASLGSSTKEQKFDRNGGVTLSERPCKNEAYCLNGGRCYVLEYHEEPYCRCGDGFEGPRCAEKSSTYQQNITSCNLPQYKDEHFCKQ